MEHVFNHEVTYTNEGRIPVRDVAASLIANEQLLLEAAKFLEELYPGLEVTGVELNFQSATTSSPLRELIAGAIFLTYQEDLKKEVPTLITKLGIPVPDDMKTIVTVTVMLVMVYGLSKAVELFGPKKKANEAAPAITGDYNTILHFAGDVLATPPEEIAKALRHHFRGPRGRPLAKKAIEFIRPAKQEHGAGVTAGGLMLSAQAVAEAPSPWEVDAAEDEEPQTPYLRQEVVIHATDLDSLKTGWAGHLPGLSEGRLRMVLYPTVDPDELYGRRRIVADIILVSRLTKSGDFQPYLFHVVKIH